MNIGLIGFGFMGGAHLAALVATPEATLKAVATRTRPTPDAPARGNLNLKAGPLPSTVEWHPDWRTVVENPEIDAVDLCLPTPLHKQVILSAFEHGKHVLCEKPLALTPEDCDEILEAAATANRTFMVAQVLRFMTPYREAASFLRAEATVQSCTLRRSTGFPQWSDWLADPNRSGGAILDLLSHDLDQALSWFGAPLSVSANSLGEIDTACVKLHYPNALDVTVEGGWLAPEATFSQSFDLRTAKASLAFSDAELHLTRAGATDRIALPEQDPYAEEIAYFLTCCRTGEAPALCLPTESANAVRLATLASQSREQDGRELPWK